MTNRARFHNGASSFIGRIAAGRSLAVTVEIAGCACFDLARYFWAIPHVLINERFPTHWQRCRVVVGNRYSVEG